VAAKTLETEDKDEGEVSTEPGLPDMDIEANEQGQELMKKRSTCSKGKKNRRSRARKRLEEEQLAGLQFDSRNPPFDHVEMKPLWTTKNPETKTRKSDAQLRRERRKRSKHNAKVYNRIKVDETGGGRE
jgi:hypothetical protein